MTNRKYTNRRYLDALEKKVLVFDGAMGTSLQLQNLTAEHFGGQPAWFAVDLLCRELVRGHLVHTARSDGSLPHRQ